MPTLTSQNGQHITLTGRVLVGRDVSQCQIVLDEPFISRLQAAIEISKTGQAAIKNLSSRMTTFVNGKVVDVCILNDGDLIEFGAGKTISFTFRQDAEVNNYVPEFSFSSLPVPPASGDKTFEYRNPQTPTSVIRVDLSSRLRIGRAPDNEIVLDSPAVSRHHAELQYQNGGQPYILDIGSTNGTYVNGQILRGNYQLQPSDWVTIGGYLLKIEGRNVTKQDLSASRIAAFSVSKSYGEKTVLNNVSVAFFPREFVGLMGASGCGKSTLMDALNGMRPASSGAVYINDLDLYRNFDALRRSIGYVPQRDILHEALTVERTLYYAARMRLPSGATAPQINETVNEVIATVGLDEQRHNAFKQLSGGQQKRLSLGIELLTKPNFLFLDEPTSPLDPETTEAMMMLFRQLADEGRIVIMVTHKFEKFNSMHNIVLLTKGGRLAYFGPPHEALEYFNCTEPGEIYRRLHERTPEETELSFQRSPQFQKYVASRFGEMQELIGSGSMQYDPSLSQTGAERKFGIGQWLTLTQRLFEIKIQDLRNTAILLVQAPLVALILAFITDNTPNDARTIFISAIIAMWLGANNAIREIVSEKDVYTRERLVNLKIPSYVFSKFAVLSVIGLIQVFLFVFILVVFDRFKREDVLMIISILYVTNLAGAATGLFCSAVVSSTEKAMSILPLILIPQLLLSGFLNPLEDIYVNVKKERPVMVADYDKYERDKDKEIKFDPSKPNEKPVIPEPVQKSEGLGGPAFLANFITARWTIDALAHQVSQNDPTARDKLASRITVTAYENVLNGEAVSKIEDAYASRVRFDLFILVIFSVLFLSLTMVALKQKDAL